MFSNLFSKTLYDKKNFVIGWSLGMIAMIGLTLAFFPSLSKGNGYEQLLSSIPKQFQSLLGDLGAYRTAAGYLGSAVFELRVPLIALPMAIILGINLSVGEEAAGQLYQLLAQPISRGSVVLQKWFALLVCMVVIHAAGLIGIEGVLLAINRTIPLGIILNQLLMSTLLCVAIGSVAMAIGFGSGRKGLSTAVASLIVFGSYLVTSFATQVSWLKWADYASLFRYYHPSIVVKQGLNMQHISVLSVVAFVALMVGILAFNRRDVGTEV